MACQVTNTSSFHTHTHTHTHTPYSATAEVVFVPVFRHFNSLIFEQSVHTPFSFSLPRSLPSFHFLSHTYIPLCHSQHQSFALFTMATASIQFYSSVKKKNSAENNNILEYDRSDVVISILAPPTRQKYRRAEEACPTDKTMISLHRRREWEEEKREK